MKIFGINQTSNINFNKKIEENKKTQSPITKNQTEIAKNSLAETIGRSQVSFKGESKLAGNILQYENVAKLTGKSENFVYNKEDGSLEYEEYTGNNTLKKRYKFNPTKGIEEITLLQPNGTTTIKRIEPDLYTFERFNELGDILYHEEADDDSEEAKMNRVSVTYEYGDKEREIIRRYKNGQVTETEVIDPRTGEVVTEGRLLEITFKKDGGWTMTANIVTGDVYEKERKVSGKRVFYEEYSRKTLELIHEFKTNNETGETTETKYTDDGKNILFRENKTPFGFVLYSAKYDPKTLKLVKESSYDVKKATRREEEYTSDGIIQKTTITEKDGTTFVTEYDKDGNRTQTTVSSKNKRDVDEYKYDKNGKTISDIHYSYKRNGRDLDTKTEYIPDTEIIKTKTDYKSETHYTIYEYNTNSVKTNVPVESQTYEYNVIVSADKYFSDGETIEYQAIYDEDRYITLSKFAKNGRMIERYYLTDTGENYKYEKFDENENLLKQVKILKGMGIVETTNFKDGVKRKFTRTNQTDGKPIVQIEYYADGRTERTRRDFNADGSYVKTEFDEYGNITSQTKHAAERSQKTDNSQKTEQTTTNTRSTKKSQEELLRSLSNKVAKSLNFTPSQATQEEIDTILEVTGLDNADSLFSLNKVQYRTLAKKFHPDKWQSESKEKQEFASMVFQIISNLYSNSPNEGV